MKKRTRALCISLLIACLMMTACSTEESPKTEADSTIEMNAKPEPAKMNSYNIGGKTILLNTRIEDYITPDKKFRFFDLAKDLGWREIVYANGMVDHSYVRIIDNSDETLYISYEIGYYQTIENISFGTIRQMERYPYSGMGYRVWNQIPAYEKGFDSNTVPEDTYNITEELNDHIFFSQIVVTVYIMENIKNGNVPELLDELFESAGDVDWYIRE